MTDRRILPDTPERAGVSAVAAAAPERTHDMRDIPHREETREAGDDPGGGIRARDVTVTYRNGHTALRDASFEIPRGTITALVGVNGAGKSTLFKAIMGFVPAAKGDIRLLGRSVKDALRSNLVAYVPQSEEVDWSFPVLVEDVVMMGRYGHMGFLRRPSQADRDSVEKALCRVNMQEFRHRQIGELSGGQRKRVFLARALAQDGQVILLDEPFTGVDVKTEEQIVTLLRELRDEGRVMLVSTHNLGSVPEFCDRTILVKGTVLAHGPTETTFTRKNLERAFGGVLRHFTLGGEALHDDHDADSRSVTIFTDDERPLVHYGGQTRTRDQK
jgi:manganese/iron transport system ATP-binding protein